MVRVRVRQHVNPLSLKYRLSLILPDWLSVYSSCRPLHLDLGCARGKFLLQMAQLNPEMNFLGLEIRHPLVIDANQQAQTLGLSNLYFMFGNASYNLADILASIPDLNLTYVTIQFPDPWFKKRHAKRRMVQSELVAVLASHLRPSGKVFLQSDLEAITIEMATFFDLNPSFSRVSPEFLESNPLGVATEREVNTLARGEAVYRLLFEKKLHTQV